MSVIESSIDFLANYFNRNLKPNVKAYYVKKFSDYDETEFAQAVDSGMDNGVFVKFPYIPELRQQLERYCKKTRPIYYNRDSDNRFPVGLMWIGYNTLVNDGENRFSNYCENVRMPLDDRQRIIDKHRISYNVKELTNNMLRGE